MSVEQIYNGITMVLNSARFRDLLSSIWETLILLGITGTILTILGLLLGYTLYITEPKGLFENNKGLMILNRGIAIITDTLRSIPFILLIIFIMPITLFFMRTTLGWQAAVPALIISATPFYARISYNAFKEIPKGNIEALFSLGTSRIKIFLIIIKEALPNLIKGLTVTLVTLIGFMAAAGAVGTGGLGALAVERFWWDQTVSFIAAGLLLVFVYIIQFTGDFIAKSVDKR